VVQGYWASFVNHLNPNTARLPGSPVWEVWGAGRARMNFVTNATKMGPMSLDLNERCIALEPLVRVLETIQANGTKTELTMS
jgi:hypothetical protein